MKIEALSHAPGMKQHVQRIPLDITNELVQFQITDSPRFVTAKENRKDPGYLLITFEKNSDKPNRVGDNPVSYLIAGVGYVPEQYWRRLKKVKMADGLEWFIYFDNRAEPDKCLAKHPYFKGEVCQRKINHSGNHQAREEAIDTNEDGTDFSDWGHALSLDWPR
ncbi:hypothetical protein SEA_PHEROBRINE_81 [Gordonia phage Pherobrine]|nr:hypothetical protein SEA_PHEROBRINE_81 [Gordonia phage Pherobrine]